MGTFIENSRTQQLQSKLLSLTVCLFCGETEVSFIFLYFIFLSVLLAIVNLPPWYVKVIINLYKFYKLYTLFIIIILFFFSWYVLVIANLQGDLPSQNNGENGDKAKAIVPKPEILDFELPADRACASSMHVGVSL